MNGRIERTVRVDYNQPFDDPLSRLVPASVHRAQQGQQQTVRQINLTDGGLSELQGSHTSPWVELVAKASNLTAAVARLTRSADTAHLQRRSSLERPTARIHKLEKRLGLKTVNAMVAEYLAGESTRSLATRYSISKTTVSDAVRAAGHELRSRGTQPAHPPADRSSAR
jgi:hypothetical protein